MDFRDWVRGQIDFGCPVKNERFGRALSELVSILFAVVFGVGLSELGEFDGLHDLYVLLVAYVSIIASWWGYHYGTIKGPSETNAWSYFVDIGIVICYWFLINEREPLWTVALIYTIIFLLYAVWEFIRLRQGRWRGAKAAMLCNIIFTLLASGLILFSTFASYAPIAVRWAVPSAVLLLVAAYRYRISQVYSRDPQPDAEPHPEP